MSNNNIYKKIIEAIKSKGILKEGELVKLKREIAIKHKLGKIPTNIEILLSLSTKERQKYEKALVTKPTRTISGVTPIAIMTSPEKCPHKNAPCITCPGGINSHFGNIPQSYTGHEPATMRGIRNNFDPYLQIFNRLEQYILLGQSCEKVELIIMGGTFPAREKTYQNQFIMLAFKAMNDFSNLFFKDNKLDFKKFKTFFELPTEELSKARTQKIQKKILKLKSKSTLKTEQKTNETTKVRCIGLTIETRPDYAQLEHANLMLEQGCTRVELGIQSTQEKVLEAMNRGHTTKQTIKAIQTLKDLGFKINAHFMLGLPKQSNRDIYKLFTKQEYRPDMLKIYPCMVMPGTELEKDYKKGKYKPLTTEQVIKQLSKFKTKVPKYVRIMRTQRDIPTKVSIAGVDKTNLRQLLQNYMKKRKLKCNCIRCNEIKTEITDPKLKVLKYKASKGKEFFIYIQQKKNIIGFCRLRFPKSQLREEITKDTAIIRELHVYGKATGIKKQGKVQHKGFGKQLMQKAEQICKKNKKTKLLVISGIGVREYYKKIGYKQDGPYVSKKL